MPRADWQVSETRYFRHGPCARRNLMSQLAIFTNDGDPARLLPGFVPLITGSSAERDIISEL